MAKPVEARNRILDAEYGTGANSGTFMSLHDSDPAGDAASAIASELSGGSPAYARKQLNLASAEDGAKALAATATFDVPAGRAFSHWALWSVASGGSNATLKDTGPLNRAELAYGEQGQYVVDAFPARVA